MKTTQKIFTKNSMYVAAFLFVSVVFFSACNDSESIETDDTNLIAKIDAAQKTTVSTSQLPSAIDATFNDELADSYIDNALLATNLGYKVEVYTFNESKAEATSDVYFNLQGKQLNDTREKSQKRRHKCFEFVFPIDFIMPDASVITLNSKDDWTLIRDWYTNNPSASEKPELVFPVDITLEDGTVQTLLDIDELKAVKQNCKAEKDKRKCFHFLYPVTFTMPDATTITVTERSDYRKIKFWYKIHPRVKERPTVVFPVDIEYKDGTTATITNETELQAAKDSCN